MSNARRPIFRDAAIKQYIQGRDKDVLPRYVSPPIFLFLWIVVGFCITTGLIAWSTRIPVYVSGLGTVVKEHRSGQMVAIIFLSPDQRLRVRPGEPAQLQIGTLGPLLKQTVTFVKPNILSPGEARQDYNLDGAISLVVPQPSFVVVVALDARLVSPLYRGSLLRAEIQVGSQRVLSLLPVVGSLFGG